MKMVITMGVGCGLVGAQEVDIWLVKRGRGRRLKIKNRGHGRKILILFGEEKIGGWREKGISCG